MRITTGQYKGRAIDIPKGDGTRPTTDKMRQAVFNVLTHSGYLDANDPRHCLDMYAGTGALGIEAVSRGLCKHVTFIENDYKAYDALARNCQNILDKTQYKMIKQDACKAKLDSYDLIFLDPPYKQDLIAKALDYLMTQNAIKDKAVLVVEVEKELKLYVPKGFEEFQNKQYGMSNIYFWVKQG